MTLVDSSAMGFARAKSDDLQGRVGVNVGVSRSVRDARRSQTSSFCWEKLVSPEGIEPSTYRLRAFGRSEVTSSQDVTLERIWRCW